MRKAIHRHNSLLREHRKGNGASPSGCLLAEYVLSESRFNGLMLTLALKEPACFVSL